MNNPLPFDIIPKGRSKLDKDAYKFQRWLMRKNRKQITENLKQMSDDLLMFGQYVTKDGKVIKMETFYHLEAK